MQTLVKELQWMEKITSVEFVHADITLEVNF